MPGTFKSGGHNRKGQPEPLAEDRLPWEQQPRETSTAFEAFDIYRQLGPQARSVSATAERLSKSVTTLKRWTMRWSWRERAIAWDMHLAEAARQAELDAVRDMRQREVNLGMAMQAIGGARLQELADVIERGEVPELSVNEARQLVDVGLKLERRARGEPETITESRVYDIDPKDLTDEQIERIVGGEDIEKVLRASNVH